MNNIKKCLLIILIINNINKLIGHLVIGTETCLNTHVKEMFTIIIKCFRVLIRPADEGEDEGLKTLRNPLKSGVSGRAVTDVKLLYL